MGATDAGWQISNSIKAENNCPDCDNDTRSIFVTHFSGKKSGKSKD